MKNKSTLKQTTKAMQQLRGLQALAKIQRNAASRGLSSMTCAEIDAEIRAARAARR